MNPDEVEAFLDQKAAEMAEHFDAVRIFASVHSGDNSQTQAFTAGVGNFYAQIGQVKEWIETQTQLERNQANEQNDA